MDQPLRPPMPDPNDWPIIAIVTDKKGRDNRELFTTEEIFSIMKQYWERSGCTVNVQRNVYEEERLRVAAKAATKSKKKPAKKKAPKKKVRKKR